MVYQSTPPHKQTDPAKKPGQIVNPVKQPQPAKEKVDEDK